MSILACLIGILTLMISVTLQVKQMEDKGRSDEERARALENRQLKRSTVEVEKQLMELEKRIERERSTVAELQKLKDRQIVLREKIEELEKAKDPSGADAELQKVVEELRHEIAVLKQEGPPLDKRKKKLEEQIRKREQAPEPPRSVQVRPGGTSLNKARNIFFVECHSTGITLLETGKKPVRVTTGAISGSKHYRAFLKRVKNTRDSMVLFLLRRDGNEAYLWAAGEAETKYQVNTGKLPLPNNGKLDLSLFD